MVEVRKVPRQFPVQNRTLFDNGFTEKRLRFENVRPHTRASRISPSRSHLRMLAVSQENGFDLVLFSSKGIWRVHALASDFTMFRV
jgi:hypothetical protein